MTLPHHDPMNKMDQMNFSMEKRKVDVFIGKDLVCSLLLSDEKYISFLCNFFSVSLRGENTCRFVNVFALHDSSCL